MGISKFQVFEGEKYGRLTILSVFRYKSTGNTRYRQVLCRCDCGNEKFIAVSTIIKKLSKSCGCLSSELAAERNRSISKTHGMTYDPLYRVWYSMIDRCYKETSTSYKNYGGRGIKVCDRWLEPNHQGLYNFVEDMGEKPSENHSIDRIDVNGNYEPSNCRWSTKYDQGFNKRRSNKNTTGRTGVYYREDINKYCANITFEGKRHGLGYFIKLEDAIEARKMAEIEYYGYSLNE